MFAEDALLPRDILIKELLPFFDATSLVRLSGCSKNFRSVLSSSSDTDIDTIWQCLHEKRWCTSSQAPSDGEWCQEYKRRHLLDASVRTKLRSPSHGRPAAADPAWRYLLLRGGPDIADLLHQIANPESGLEADEFEREVAETALVAINRLDVVKEWKRLMRVGNIDDDEDAQEQGTRPSHIEDGAILIARFYVDRERVLADLDTLGGMERRIGQDLNYLAHRLSLRLLSRFRNIDEVEALREYGYPILGIGGVGGVSGGGEYPVLAILEEMQHIFRGTDECSSGFFGNQEDYYAYENSLIDQVFINAKGIPITLSILYAAIVRRATEVIINPVGLPGHFILGTQQDEDGRVYFIDAFRRGEILNVEQVKGIVASYGYPWNDGLIQATVPYPEVWMRMLRNLLNAHTPRTIQQLGSSSWRNFHFRMRESLTVLYNETLGAVSSDEALVGRHAAFERHMCG